MGETQELRGSVISPAAERVTQFVAGDEVGEYRIEHKLGEGGMGTVYAGVHTVIGKRAAIKLLRKELCANPEAIGRFVQEARAVNQIGHPNIVDVFGFGTASDGRAFLAMEWLDGESLGARMDAGRLPFDEIYNAIDHVARALAAAHAAGIVHRDLKPDNVFLADVRDGPPIVKLLDFGIAKLTRDEAGEVSRTKTGAIIGTPQYIAPEQARGYAIDGAADIYSLGVMWFELMVGAPPFTADNAMDLIAKHLSEPPPSLRSIDPTIPPAVEALVHRMLSKRVTGRPSLNEIREVLATIRRSTAPIAVLPTLAMPVALEVPEALAARRRSRWPIIGLTGMVMIGLLAFVVVREIAHETDTMPPTTPSSRVEPLPVAPAVNSPRVEAKPVEPPTPPGPTAEPDATFEIALIGDDHATLTIDGETDQPLRARTAISLAPGHHVLEITAPQRSLWRKPVNVRPGEAVKLSVRLARVVPSRTTAPTPVLSTDDDGLANPFRRRP